MSDPIMNEVARTYPREWFKAAKWSDEPLAKTFVRETASMLKRYGFSAFKAAEIELDARRGDAYALHFVRLAVESGK